MKLMENKIMIRKSKYYACGNGLAVCQLSGSVQSNRRWVDRAYDRNFHKGTLIPNQGYINRTHDRERQALGWKYGSATPAVAWLNTAGTYLADALVVSAGTTIFGIQDIAKGVNMIATGPLMGPIGMVGLVAGIKLPAVKMQLPQVKIQAPKININFKANLNFNLGKNINFTNPGKWKL